MKLIFLGTPAFAVPALKRLARSRHDIVAVITQPDRPRGRGMDLAPPPVKTTALELGLEVTQPDQASSPSTIESIAELRPEAAAVVAYGQILKREFLDVPPCGCINLHPSLLPRYRGATPIQSPILAGDTVTGVTTILLDEGMDTGDILLQRKIDIARDDTAGSLHDKLAEAGAELVVETLDAVENGSVTPRQQDESKATVTRKFSKDELIIDWSQSPEMIYNHTRAMNPLPGCRTKIGGKALKVWKVIPCESQARNAEPGEIRMATRDSLIVQAGGGAVRLLELQMPGRKRMSAEEFLRGNPIEEGTVLGN